MGPSLKSAVLSHMHSFSSYPLFLPHHPLSHDTKEWDCHRLTSPAALYDTLLPSTGWILTAASDCLNIGLRVPCSHPHFNHPSTHWTTPCVILPRITPNPCKGGPLRGVFPHLKLHSNIYPRWRWKIAITTGALENVLIWNVRPRMISRRCLICM